ncbi:MAG: hypothetical protein JSW37_13370, partial [Anaerolineales bacterium]
RVYLTQEGQELPEEPRRLGIVMSGPRRPVSWAGATDELLDFYDLKGIVETLLDRLRLTDCTFAATEHPTFQSGRVAKLLVHSGSEGLGAVEIGVLGEVHPLVLESFGLPAQHVCLAELDLEALLAQVPPVHRYRPLSRFPEVTRDLALVVNEGLAAEQVRETIARAGGKLLHKIELFDVYRGKQIPVGKKSLAYALTYQAPDRTLTDKEVDRLQERIQNRLQKELGATLRA